MKSLSDLTATDFVTCGLSDEQAADFLAAVQSIDPRFSASEIWMRITKRLLLPEHPLAVHELLHRSTFAEWNEANGPAPAWFPDDCEASNISWLMKQTGLDSYRDLHAWSVQHPGEFWSAMVHRIGVRFQEPFTDAVDLKAGAEHPRWLVGAKFNIVESCFQSSADSTAIVVGSEDQSMRRWSTANLQSLVGRVANGLLGLGFQAGDRVSIDMPMTAEAVAIYLGAITIGCPVVTIADSFAVAEIQVRLKIGDPRVVFTQDVIRRGGKELPLLEKVQAAAAPTAIVIACREQIKGELRAGDMTWEDFLSARTEIPVRHGDPTDTTTILFSSGTTGAPKAIPWDQTTPIKAAVDAHLHHDVRPGDVLCWPSNMGWMMGPWLVYAALMNKSVIALYDGAPTTREFAQFVADARVTMLGLVPSLVSSWRASGCLSELDWSGIRAFSSTGECSNPRDMFFLMAQAKYKPIIEYCGGTEIGGGYITGTVVQPAAPSTFSTPALGIDLTILDEQNQPADRGEVFLIPPSMGLSSQLLNGDHHAVYFAGAPTGEEGQVLRRHGDELQRLANGYFRAHGRADDSMNLGGIKVSSLQIEEVAAGVIGIHESAAIAVPPTGGGPDKLIVYVVLRSDEGKSDEELKTSLQRAIRTQLNPLFKLHAVVVTDSLPRTASNKIMRRTLRAQYEDQTQNPPNGGL